MLRSSLPDSQRLVELNASPDRAVAKAVFESLMALSKTDHQAIERAAEQAAA